MILTKDKVLADIALLPKYYKTAHIDGLIKEYVRQQADASALRDLVLNLQQLHRIYYFVNLKQIKDVNLRMKFIDDNLLFNDWWHTDQLIGFVKELDFNVALDYAKKYVNSKDPFIRRWGYVFFISKLGHNKAQKILPLLKNDDHYYSQMAQAWLIAELAIFESELIFKYLKETELKYNITGKAIQKILDSFRISADWKLRFKELRPILKLV